MSIEKQEQQLKKYLKVELIDGRSLNYPISEVNEKAIPWVFKQWTKATSYVPMFIEFFGYPDRRIAIRLDRIKKISLEGQVDDQLQYWDNFGMFERLTAPESKGVKRYDFEELSLPQAILYQCVPQPDTAPKIIVVNNLEHGAWDPLSFELDEVYPLRKFIQIDTDSYLAMSLIDVLEFDLGLFGDLWNDELMSIHMNQASSESE